MPGDVVDGRIFDSEIKRVDNVGLHVQDLSLLELLSRYFVVDDTEF